MVELKTGQRWFFSKNNQKEIVEITIKNTYSSGFEAKTVQFISGKKSSLTWILPSYIPTESQKYWTYLKGQDKPLWN